jgi:hypothetical protein
MSTTKNRAAKGPSQSRPAIETPARTGTSCRVGIRVPLYLFACHLEWRNTGNVAAYEELLAVLDDPDGRNRAIAGALQKRSPPRPQPGKGSVKRR